MAISTRPMLVFEPLTYTYEYDASSGDEPDDGDFTLSGTDHASVSGGVMTIASAGTDANAYYQDVDGLAATDVLVGRAELKLDADCATAAILVEADTLGVKLRLLFEGSTTGVLTVEGVGPAAADVDYAVDMTTDYVDVLYVLSASGWRLYVDTGDGLYELGSGTPEAYSGGNDRLTFGKISTADDDDEAYWKLCGIDIADKYAFSYPPNGWDVDSRTPQRAINVAHDGTVETVYYRDDQDIRFRSQSHTNAQKSTLTGYFTTYMSPGYRFWICADYSDIQNDWYPVKHIDKGWRWKVSAFAPTHWDMDWSLRVVEE